MIIMAKKNKKTGISTGTALLIIIAVLLILSFVFVQEIKDFILEAITLLGTAIGNALFSLTGDGTDGGVNIPPPDGTLPAEKPDCTYYDFNFEFNRFFGIANMDLVGQSCRDLGGIWTSTNDEVGCEVPPTFLIDCNADGYDWFESFCESGALTNNQGVKGDYYCDNTRHYVGCICPITTHPPPIPPPDNGDDDQDEYTCGWHDTTWGRVCEGTCPDGKVCIDTSEVTCECKYIDGEEQVGGIGTVFVTKNVWNGALGNIDGADAKCQVSADFSPLGLTGVWIAIISDDFTNAIDRLPDIPYTRIDGMLIANNKADLFDGNIMNEINIDEHGNIYSNYGVWTGSTPFGLSTPFNCNNWGWVDADGTIGSTLYTSGEWLDLTTNVCSNGNKIYCVRVS